MTRSLTERRRAEATASPDWIKPQLTKLVDEPPAGPEWLDEIKFDGYRMHARRESETPTSRFEERAPIVHTRTGDSRLRPAP